jgi:hypothetical protein
MDPHGRQERPAWNDANHLLAPQDPFGRGDGSDGGRFLRQEMAGRTLGSARNASYLRPRRLRTVGGVPSVMAMMGQIAILALQAPIAPAV